MVPVHESRVTNVQNCVEPRACSEGASVDHTDARKADTDGKARQIADLQAKLQRKHEVLSELMEEHVQLKKALGGP